MKPERWEQIESLYHDALQLERTQRTRFLESACQGDADLKREVELLLSFDEKADHFMAKPAFDVVSEMIADIPADSFTGTAGSRFAHYELIEKLGSGGMGVVYKARDEHLQRLVALKLVPERFVGEEKWLERFKREARAASALNAPNVVTIYEAGQIGSTPYIAMEFVQGRTLRQKLSEGPVPMSHLLQIAHQLAVGISKIHEAGLIHLDLKPENVLITDEGLVKILDFGLAKLGPIAGNDPAQDASSPSTQSGVAGTLSYMSPEQCLGGHIDFRSDQFSLGTILYEMAAGKRAFQRQALTFHEITSEQLEPLELLRPDVTPGFRKVLYRCLERQADLRYTSSQQLAYELQALSDRHTSKVSSLSRPFVPRVPRGRRIALIAAISMVLAFGFAVGSRKLDRLWEGSSSPNKVQVLAILPFENLSGDTSTAEILANGMTDEFISQIGQISDQRLRILSATTMMSYRESRKAPDTIAEELKADVVLETSATQNGEDISIDTNLIRPGTGKAFWTHSYHQKLEDLLSLTRTMAIDVARELGIVMTLEEQRHLTRVQKLDPAGPFNYLTGRVHFDSRTAEGLRDSSEEFSLAIQQDPQFAAAYAGLANSLIVQDWFSMLPPFEAYTKARDAALQAIALDPNLAEGHAALGRIQMVYENDWSGAEDEFKTAMRLSQSSPLAYQWYAFLLTATSRFDEAIFQMQRAVDRDPRSPIIYTTKGWILYLAGKYDQARAELGKALELNHDFQQAMDTLAETYETAGLPNEAFEEWQKWAEAGGMPEAELANLRRSYLRGGIKGYWRERLNMEIEEAKQTGNVWLYQMARLNARVGNKTQAISYLEQAYVQRSSRMVLINVDPIFAGLRADPRFIELTKKLGLSR